MNRRAFLQASAAVLAGSVGLPLLSACSALIPSKPPTSGSAASGGRVQLPLQIALPNLPQPELPPSTDGTVSPGFTRFPSNLLKSVPHPPGQGSDVNALTVSLSPAPIPVEQNATWQQVNKELGVNLKMPIVSTVDYPTRLNTVVAGGELPDIIAVTIFTSTLQNIGDFLQSRCEDLTPHLGGDAIKDYPNLANLPAYVWPPTVFNNKIYAVPVPTGGIRGNSPILFARYQALDEAGITGIKSLDEFTGVLKQLNNPGTRWAIGAWGLLKWLVQVFGGPNQWAESGGKFTRDYETDAYKQAVAYHRSLWDAGVFHPDSPSLSGSPAGAQYYGGKFIFAPYASWASYQTVWDRTIAADPNFKPRAIMPFGVDGKSRAPQFLGSGYSGLSALKKANPERVKELLGVLNYLAAPIGTQEQLLLAYGALDSAFKFDANGSPVPTQQALQEMAVPWKNLGAPPDFLFSATSADYTPVTHQSQTDIFAVNLPNPTVSLYSPTQGSKGTQITATWDDAVNQIIWGREPVSSLDGLIRDWRAKGGDQIRKEYEEAIAAAKA